MKRFLFLFLMLLATNAALAQNGLHVESYFTATAAATEGMNTIRLSGKKVSSYGLSLFHSVTLKASKDKNHDLEKKVLKDARNAIFSEAGTKDGRLYYGFYRLPSTEKKNRYLFYRNNALRNNADDTLIVIYMEGSASIEELKKTFGK